MTRYVLRRLVALIPVLLVVGVVVFSLVHLTPGDPAAVILGDNATPEQVQQLRHELGLDAPLYRQFVHWFGDAARLQFGQSLFLGRPVTRALLDRAQPTGLLTLYALVVATAIGVPAGIVAALRRNTLLDRALMMIAISGIAIPSFVLGILLILLFAVVLHWLPAGGYVPLTTDPGKHFRTMVMPAFSLGFASAALLARIVRSSMLDVLREDYVRTAYAKGLRTRAVVVRHALRNALIPVVTVIGLSLGGLLSGAVVTETVFNLPGMGQLVVQSVLRRDFPVIQGAVMVTATAYLLVNLVVDVLYVYLDPRIRYGSE
ncbi:MAG: ABC transporter permease [Chloroflexota bacterium]|nr:ABC transporter permease [Chloroflexota bacterium]MDQ6907152.1 ABC transporter permease [Chloroflexota bacterium]